MTSDRLVSFVGLALVWLCAALLSPSQAAAQPEFEATIREALAEFEAGRWTEARALFLQAHEIRPSAEALRMAGNASYEAREYVRAVELLEAALAEERRPLREDTAALARDALAAASRFVTRLTVVVPDGAAVRVDDVQRDPARPITLPRGEHMVEVSADGYETRRQRVLLDADERTLRLSLRATPDLRVVPEESVVDAPPTSPEAGGPDAWVWVVVGLVAAAAVGATIGIALGVQSEPPFGANAPGRLVFALEVGP